MSPDPLFWLPAFESWKRALQLDGAGELSLAAVEFQNAADLFFKAADTKAKITRPLLEYTTLMEAFSLVEKARLQLDSKQYEEALPLFSKVSDNLRASLHFAYLAPYLSACASLEVALSMSASEEKFEACRNSIGLLEQAKIGLSLQDDKHPVIHVLDAMLKFAIATALKTEGDLFAAQGREEDAAKKYAQHGLLEAEYLSALANSTLTPHKLYFFPAFDFQRVESGAFLVSYPDAEELWLVNMGKHAALLESLGEVRLDMRIEPGESLSFPLKDMRRGRIKVTYKDAESGAIFVEGCISLT